MMSRDSYQLLIVMGIIETHNLTRMFNHNVAVDGLTLEVEQGEVMGFLGPNGAGKTTTIRMLTGMILPTSGYALVAGFKTSEQVEQLHETIGIVMDIPGFYNRMSAKRNLEFFAGFYPKINTEVQIEKYLRLIGLWERRDDAVGTFSKGMKQRLALARALLHEPKILFLDEPTAGLDPEVAGEVRTLIKQLSAGGYTIFLSTHNLNEAESLCDRIALINGRLVALDSVQNLQKRYFRREIVIKLEKIDRSVVDLVKNLSYVGNVHEESNQLFIELNDPILNRPDLVKAIVNVGGRILEVSEVKHPLEELYVKLIHEEK